MPRPLLMLACVLALPLLAPAQDKAAAPQGRALVIVDKSVYPELKAGLDTYAGHILKELKIAVVARPDDYYGMKPAAIREILHKEYQDKQQPPLIGAILCGPIPHALKGDPKESLIPITLFYEDFDAKYEDKNNDGVYEDEEITNDRVHNPTEIWTSWWVPPANDGPTQVKLLKGWLEKLDRYYKGQLTGRDQMLWMTGNVTGVEICEGWTVLFKDTMKPLAQKLYIWSKEGQDEGTFRPNKRKEEFGPRDFLNAFTAQPWQHVHVIAHGNQRGWYWDSVGVISGLAASNKPEASLQMDFSTFKGTAANIITTSGCSNGNFRGDYLGPVYDRALGSNLLFSPDTITVAYYGAASPQSTSGFAGFCTELIESLRADGGSYIAEGYKKMRNSDYSWGREHFFFRGGDEKILNGDPFAHYRDSAAPTAEQAKALQDKFNAAGWTVVGPG
jgi:hypothetical protein